MYSLSVEKKNCLISFHNCIMSAGHHRHIANNFLDLQSTYDTYMYAVLVYSTCTCMYVCALEHVVELKDIVCSPKYSYLFCLYV